MGPTHILQTVHIVVLVLASFVRSAPGATPRFDPSTPISTLGDDDLSPTTTLPAERSVPDTPGPSATASPLPPSGRAIYTESHLAGVMTRWGHDDSAAGVSRLDDAAILTRVDVLKELRDHSPVSACRTALSSLLEARNQLKIWALKMHSSTVALPDALLSGTMYHMGDFDGCLGVPDSMYCTLDVEVRPVGSAGQAHDGDEVSPFDPPHGANGTLWDVLKTSGNRRRYRRDLQQWSLCLPEACGVSEGVDGVLAADADLRRQLGMAMAASVDGLAKTMGVELVVRLDPNDCTVYEQEHPAAEGFWAIVPPFVNAVLANLNDPLFLLGSLFIVAFPSLVALASALHIVKLYMMPKDGWLSEKEGALMTVLSCFSLQTNFNALKKQRKNNINAVQGLRFMNMVFVILGHRCMNLYGGPTLNPEFVEDSFTMAMRMYIINGNIIVSTFFVISAFFSARLCLAEFSKPRGFTLPLLLNMWLHRFLRFLPGLAVVVTIEVLWVEHMGTGPIWNQLVGRSVQDCKNNWWSHLLFVNNYVNPNSLCLIQSWFLAADFQLFLLTPLVMWLVSRWTRRGARCWPGFALLAGLLLAACASHYVFSVLYNLHPMVHTYPQVLRRWIVVMDPTFIYQYVTTHSNAIPYVIGLMAGTLFHLAKQQEWEPSKWMRRTLFLGIPVSHGVQVAIFCTGVCFFLPTFKDHPMADALYGPARMLLFSSATAWVIVSCGLGFGGFFEWILTFTPLRILGRLTYSVFLVHITYINVTAGYTRSPEFLASFFVALKVFADVMASFMLGAILHLFVEAPMWNVQKLLLTLAVGTKKDETPAQESRTANAVAAEAPPNYLNRQDVNTISARVAPTTNWPGMAVSSSRL